MDTIRVPYRGDSRSFLVRLCCTPRTIDLAIRCMTKAERCVDIGLRIVGPVYVTLAVSLISGVIYVFFTSILPQVRPPTPADHHAGCSKGRGEGGQGRRGPEPLPPEALAPLVLPPPCPLRSAPHVA